MITRGERNNNPGNVDYNGTEWAGLAEDQSDSRFCVFTDPVMGIRALAKVLLSYYRKHHLVTVRAIINRWAPPNENNSDAYVSHVARSLGVEADTVIDVTHAPILAGLTRAIIAHENGRCVYPVAIINAAVAKALI